MTYEDMMTFAQDWVANWNWRDVEAVLSHFAEDAEFVSPLALQYSGRAALHGKAEISGYWRAGMQRLNKIEFTFDHASWDERLKELTVLYTANLNGDRKRACEIMRFGDDGLQTRGEALYGAAV
jgi:hypothetical protein